MGSIVLHIFYILDNIQIMLKIRLQRVGRKNDPSFRVILTDTKRGPRSGKTIEILGSYNPRKDRKELKNDRIKHWISHGAQTSNTVHNLLVSLKIIEGPKINVTPPKKVKKKSSPEDAQAAKKEKEVSAEKPAEEQTKEPDKKEAKSEENKEDKKEKKPS